METPQRLYKITLQKNTLKATVIGTADTMFEGAFRHRSRAPPHAQSHLAFKKNDFLSREGDGGFADAILFLPTIFQCFSYLAPDPVQIPTKHVAPLKRRKACALRNMPSKRARWGVPNVPRALPQAIVEAAPPLTPRASVHMITDTRRYLRPYIEQDGFAGSALLSRRTFTMHFTAQATNFWRAESHPIAFYFLRPVAYTVGVGNGRNLIFPL